MDNHIYNNISNSNISRNVNIKSNNSQTNTQLLGLGANLMPTERQTTIGVFNPSAVSKSNLDMQRYDTKRLYSPNNAPSTITSETFLMAKSLSSPMYTHNAAQTKYFNISNSAIEEPRFTKKVSVLA